MNKYVNLVEVAELIRNGEEISVINNESGEDITAITLTQIIMNREKKEGNFLPPTILSALIQIEFDNVAKWAQDKKIPFTTFKTLAQNREVYELIRKEVEDTNDKFARVENIRRFVLLEKELDHDDDELTATMKVRRKAIEEKYEDLIDSIYR